MWQEIIKINDLHFRTLSDYNYLPKMLCIMKFILEYYDLSNNIVITDQAYTYDKFGIYQNNKNLNPTQNKKELYITYSLLKELNNERNSTFSSNDAR